DTSIFGAASDKNIVFIVLGAVFAVIVGYAVYMIYRRNMALESEYKNDFLTKLKESSKLPIIMVIGFALLIRLLIAGIGSLIAGLSEAAYLGFNVEAEATQASFLANYGTVYMDSTLAAYAQKYSLTYQAMRPTPLLYYILTLAGLLSKLFNGSTVLTTFFIKLFAIAADVGVIVIIYKLLDKRLGNISALLFASLYAALPVVFSMSAAWGMSESITVFLIMLTMYFILKNNYWGVAISYFAAFLFSINAVYMLPIVIFYAVSQYINRPKLRLSILLSVIGGFALFYALSTPFYLLDIQGGSPFVAVSRYFDALFNENNYYTMNAFNFQALLKNNFEEVTTESLVITILFVVFVIGLVAAGYFRNKNRMELLLLGSLLIVMLFTFTNRMTPVTIYMAIPMMYLYAAMASEKRVFFSAIAFSAFMFINTSYVFMVAGYSATGVEQLTYDNAMMYVFGAINILLTGYFIYVVYDIVASRKASIIRPLEMPYLKYLQNTGRRIKKGFRDLKAKFSR
ncbi:MAG: hypothetical protein WBM21_01510, partial [Christensenellales bacterium]